MWKSRDLFRVFSMRNRRIPDFKAVFDQKFIFLSHVTSGWCPELSPPDTLIIFNILFFVLKNEIMDRRRKFYSLHLDFEFLAASPIFGTASTIERTCLDVFHLVKTKLWEAILVFIKVT